VEEQGTAGGGAIERGAVPEIAFNAFDVEFGDDACGANERPHLISAFAEQPRDVPPDKS
jgi:hypothetical protein